MVDGVFDPQYQGYGEKFLVRSYLKCITTTATSTSHLTYARTYVPTNVGLVGYAAVGGM
jgi:hypothetical protein